MEISLNHYIIKSRIKDHIADSYTKLTKLIVF